MPIGVPKHLWLLVALGLAGCGGGGNDDETELGFRRIETVVPESLGAAVTVRGANFVSTDSLVLAVVGHAEFDCDVRADDIAACVIPEFALPAGRHDAFLAAPGKTTAPLADALTVIAQPMLASCQPDRFDARFNSAFVITGDHFRAPATVQFLDAAGLPTGPAVTATVGADGKTVRAASPIIVDLMSNLSTSVNGGVRVSNGDGQLGRSTMPVTLVCPECEWRRIDGSGNHVDNDDWGSAGVALRRHVAAAYIDGVAAPAGASRPSARAVSNAVSQQAPAASNMPVSNFFWLWGQFIDHDIDLTPAAEPSEPFDILVPTGDVHFDPLASGSAVIELGRSSYDEASSPRQQHNAITSWLDGSQVYGSDPARQAALREIDSSGRLRAGDDDLLPLNDTALDNASLPGQDPGSLFLAGDERANEQVGLTALHTLFVREHNRIVESLAAANPHLGGTELYESARLRVIALLQKITYRDFLPMLLGADAIAPYAGYDPSLEPTIGNVFSTAAFRFGHSLVSTPVMRLDPQMTPIVDGHLVLREAFFAPQQIREHGGIEPVLRGMAAARSEELDTRIIDDLRNFMFGRPGAGGLDLASLNIQRGRDHGLPDYNSVRQGYGLDRAAQFTEVTADADLASNLQALYGNIDSIDVWVGGLAEPRRPGALVGELLQTVIADQFRRLRDGDRFYYERIFPPDARAEIDATTLADVIRRNTNIGSELPNDVFAFFGDA